jgi:hypothetical protein
MKYRLSGPRTAQIGDATRLTRSFGLLRSALTGLSMVAIEDQREQPGSENIEDDDIDIRVPFDQSEHGDPLRDGVASSSPRASLYP